MKKVAKETVTTTIRVDRHAWKLFRLAVIQRDLSQQEALEQAFSAWVGESLTKLLDIHDEEELGDAPEAHGAGTANRRRKHAV